MVQFRKEFEETCTKKFENDSKIGLLAAVAPDGYPHIALISSLSVKTKTSLMWGQFSRGLSKAYLKDNPRTGFLVVSPDQFWWTGKALHRGFEVKGEDYDYFNNKPLFRYNSYCGFGAVHYGDLVEVSAGKKLPLAGMVSGFAGSVLRKNTLRKIAPAGKDIEKIPPYGMNLGSKLACLKFAAWVDADGYPRIIPALQGVPADSGAMVFSPGPLGELLGQIPGGAKSAVFLASLELETLLLQGRWYSRRRGNRFGGAAFAVDKVYNSMLPIGGYIYPPKKLPNVYGLPEERTAAAEVMPL
ncbi:MAG: hypothetical protein LBP23_05840 [Treponema sp.]|jgi:hypothetical protein|nr:hypothetical protein [Treponema sp.]